MSRIRDIADILTASNALSTDIETAAAITTAISALPPAYPRGNTASRPASPTTGDLYSNTETGFIEVYSGATYGWEQVGGIASTVTGVTATNSGSGRAYNNGRASVAFTPGTVLGRTYTVTSSPGSYTATGSSSPILITGLQSSTQYTYTVVATNNYGTSSASSASSAVTATTVPAAPTGVSATNSENAQSVVSFTAGATGGSAITSYTVTSSPGNITASGASSPITVTGLTNDTSYTFTVTATNANGTSAASSASSSITPIAGVLTDILVIAGGGGGGCDKTTYGYWVGAGGGAGGLQYFTNQIFTIGTTHTITIGAGGKGGDASSKSAQGQNSRFGSLSESIGGGAGQNTFNATPSSGSHIGGSGGGQFGGLTIPGVDGGGFAGTAGQGYAGGQGYSGNVGYGETLGGGGGSGGVGKAPTAYGSTGRSGDGGPGTQYSTIASATSTGVGGYYAGGGGAGLNGGTLDTPGNGGSGGGGNGAPRYGNSVAGTINTGSGGGGGTTNTPGEGQSGQPGSAGGSGIVILKISGNYTASATSGSPERVTSGGYTYYTFKGTGSITF